jgi:uncharacterized membrane protein HdeD (DUF308 family)
LGKIGKARGEQFWSGLAVDYQWYRAGHKSFRRAFCRISGFSSFQWCCPLLLASRFFGPGQALLILTLLLIVFLMVEGISKVIFALTIRPFPNWGWVLASGIIGILLALYLWASLPITAIWLLGVLLGIQLICEGAAIGYLAWQVRNS